MTKKLLVGMSTMAAMAAVLGPRPNTFRLAPPSIRVNGAAQKVKPAPKINSGKRGSNRHFRNYEEVPNKARWDRAQLKRERKAAKRAAIAAANQGDEDDAG